MLKFIRSLTKVVLGVFSFIGIIASALLFFKVKSEGFYFMVGNQCVCKEDQDIQ